MCFRNVYFIEYNILETRGSDHGFGAPYYKTTCIAVLVVSVLTNHVNLMNIKEQYFFCFGRQKHEGIKECYVR